MITIQLLLAYTLLHRQRILSGFILLVLGCLMPILANAIQSHHRQVQSNSIVKQVSIKTVKHSPAAINNTVSAPNIHKKVISSYAPDIERILKRGWLIVAMPKKDNPPFYALDNKGNYWGLDVELARGFAKQLGVRIVFNREAESFDEAVKIVSEQNADLAICKLSRTFKRAMKIRYSHPYVTLHQALLINRLNFAPQVLQNPSPEEAVQKLHGKLGVIAESAYVEYAKQYFPKATIVTFDTWEQVVQAAAKGELVAAYRDELEVKKVVKVQPETALKFKTAVITDINDSLAIATAWNNPHILALINIYLEELNLSLNADKILDKYANQLFKNNTTQ
jgi:ABC-type amino acid transport substrate-binding protein